MNPFSSIYFIKENKKRCLLLMFMIFLTYGAYLGGLYITNVFDGWKIPIEYYERIVMVFPDGQDKEGSDFEAFKAKVSKDNKVKVLPISTINGFNWETIMGFENGQFAFTFQSVDDFRLYCRYMDIDCDFDSLTDGSMIMSEKFGKNRGLGIGDTIGKDYGENIYGEYTLDAVTAEDGYTLYFIDKNLTDGIMLIGDRLTDSEVYSYACKLQSSYKVYMYGYGDIRENIESQFETFHVIYMFICLFMAVILAVTINAAFVGMYQRRSSEFAVYRAIGISKRRITGKIAGELLWMDFLALAAGGSVFFSGLYLFNNLVLYPKGKYLCYFHSMALTGLALCNVIVIVPLILTRCRKLRRADICEY